MCAPQPDQLGAELLRRRPVQLLAVVLDRHLRDDRQVADAAHRRDGGADLVEVAERLEDEQVHAAVEQRPRLLAEVLLGLVHAGLAPRLDPDAQGTDGAGHVCLLARRVTGHARPRHVDGVRLVGEAEGPELDAVGAERVGLDDVGAGPDVLQVDLGDQVGLGKVQRLEAAVDEHALASTAWSPSRRRTPPPCGDLVNEWRQH